MGFSETAHLNHKLQVIYSLGALIKREVPKAARARLRALDLGKGSGLQSAAVERSPKRGGHANRVAVGDRERCELGEVKAVDHGIKPAAQCGVRQLLSGAVDHRRGTRKLDAEPRPHIVQPPVCDIPSDRDGPRDEEPLASLCDEMVRRTLGAAEAARIGRFADREDGRPVARWSGSRKGIRSRYHVGPSGHDRCLVGPYQRRKVGETARDRHEWEEQHREVDPRRDPRELGHERNFFKVGTFQTKPAGEA